MAAIVNVSIQTNPFNESGIMICFFPSVRAKLMDRRELPMKREESVGKRVCAIDCRDGEVCRLSS